MSTTVQDPPGEGNNADGGDRSDIIPPKSLDSSRSVIQFQVSGEQANPDGELDVSSVDVSETARIPTAITTPRDTWNSKFSYLLTLIGYAVGFGNVWRFPYQAQDNGGLAFLFPYSIMILLLGIPTFFLELAVGQRRRKGMVRTYNDMSPSFGGLGICCSCICFLIGTYYQTLIAYCLSYFVNSFRSPLPWTDCDSFTKSEEQVECKTHFVTKEAKYYWYRETLDASTSIERAGNYNWQLLLYQLVSWGLVWLITFSGTKILEKIAWFTTLFPHFVLLAFFIANCIVDRHRGWYGAWRLLKPNWHTLYYPLTWLKAGSQIFFSLGLGIGCLVLFASYNPARNNCHRDAVSINLLNAASSILASSVIFPMIGALGYRNYESCVADMKKVFPEHTPDKQALYDIYFSTKAKNWNEVSVRTPIHIRYGYGEMTDAQKNNLAVHLRDGEQFHTITITSLGNVSPPAEFSFAKATRDCSIGREAKASGGGTGFMFEAVAESIRHLPAPNFWAIMFFFMLTLLGIDSGLACVQGASATIHDLTTLSWRQSSSIACAVMMSIAIVLFPFGFGVYILDLLDQYTVNWTLLLVAAMECITVSWSYGLARISYDVKLMTGSKPNIFILICWKYITPLLILLLLVGSVFQFTQEWVEKGAIYYRTYEPDADDSGGELMKGLPWSALVPAFILMLLCLLWLPMHAILRNTKYSKFTLSAERTIGDFPEEELRGERTIVVVREEEQFTQAERRIMGRKSISHLQAHRDVANRRLYNAASTADPEL